MPGRLTPRTGECFSRFEFLYFQGMPSPVPLYLTLSPAFDLAEAQRLHALLDDADPGTAVHLDFHDVREFDPAALGLLARDLAAVDGRVVVHGLTRHAQRLLGYLGSGDGATAGYG